jgi:tRNA A37 threonylcarbamoyladenosine biosynthesis protein TsaE
MYNIHEPQQLVEKGIAELVHEYDYVAIEWPKFLDVL